MSVRYAFVTLLTSDAYLPGALAVAAALNDVHRTLPLDQTVEYQTVCLVTPETVDVTTIRLLRKAFDVIIGVEAIVPPDSDSLALLGRPDLDAALTKLHVFRLTQFAKVIFLDADVLPLRPLSHLFLLDDEFSAVPDVGWPDVFNSGMMVLSPGEDKFKALQELLNTKGTWDGADQGLLNEWRGNNWNRLSFTYNTTPTATYTYAPAYQRFGPQISVIHFIGPHKPWHTIPYRTLGSSAQPAEMAPESSIEPPAVQQRAYDYGSLVDRWYSIYDRHCRSQAVQPVFQPGKYTSAWNEEDPRHATVSGGALGLEELRRAALDGMGAIGISAPRVYGEGEYRTMPLEGRFDLIRPRTRAERKQVEERIREDSIVTLKSTSITAEPTATTPEFTATTAEPSTPPEKIMSLPSVSPVRWTTLPTPGTHEIPPTPHARLISLPPTPLRYVPTPYKPLHTMREVGTQTISIPSQHRESEAQNSSMTPLMFTSATRTPPIVVTPAPTDTYFSGVWETDRKQTSISLSSHNVSLTAMEDTPSRPRVSPNVVFIPSLLPFTPEASRRQEQHHSIIKEEDRSPTPDRAKVKRVFPWEERPRRVPGRVFPDEGSLFTVLSHSPVSATPERKISFRSPMPSPLPLVGFPPSFESHCPTDSPLPQRRVDGAPWSVHSSSPLYLENELDKVETSSQDGDVEDEVDSEEEVVLRSRSRSLSAEKAKRILKYHSIGVQTNPRDLREEGIQVTTFVPVTEVAEKLILMNKRLGRNWVTSAGIISPPTRTVLSSLLSPSPPTPLAKAEAGDPSSSSASSPPVSSSISPPSITGGLQLSHIGKGTRVWDPARGVEAFKRESEEVLAKFMKKGTWEECA